MLPTVLSDSLCSLQERQDRFAFVCDMVISEGGIISTAFRYAHIRVTRNFRYEEPNLLALAEYQLLLSLTKQLDASCTDSHDVVSFWMIEMNSRCATHFATHGLGIFRSVVVSPLALDSGGTRKDTDNLTDNCRRTIHLWSSNTSGQYVLFQDSCLQHDVLRKSVYIHITSPIRRLVDLLNQMMFLQHFLDVNLSEAARQFLATWIQKMDYVNVSMRSIRKVQYDCQLLFRCMHDPTLMEQTHRGVVFDRLERESGYFNYMVYMESLNLLSRVRSTKDLSNYTEVSCRMFVFEDADATHRKVRLCLV
jgi:exoribonuclease R